MLGPKSNGVDRHPGLLQCSFGLTITAIISPEATEREQWPRQTHTYYVPCEDVCWPRPTKRLEQCKCRNGNSDYHADQNNSVHSGDCADRHEHLQQRPWEKQCREHIWRRIQ